MTKCEVCETRDAILDGRFCSTLCGWAAVMGGKFRLARVADVKAGAR